MMKKGLLALSFAATVAMSTVALADQPEWMFIHNNTNSASSADINGYQSYVTIRRGAQTAIPWQGVQFACSHTTPLCEMKIYAHSESIPQYVADVFVDVPTGNISVGYVHRGYAVTVNGPGDVTISN